MRNVGPSLLATAILTIIQVAAAGVAEAAVKHTLVDAEKVTSTSFSITLKGKVQAHTAQCYKNTAGLAKTAKKQKVKFTSFAAMAKANKGKKAKVALYNALKKAGNEACRNPETPKTPGITPTNPPGTPPTDSRVLAKYTGAFTQKEARRLFNRFAFGANEARIQQAVADGLDVTVTKLMTLVPEPELENVVADITCDTWITGDPNAGNQNRTCNPNDVNDLNRTGSRMAWMYRMINSQNPFYEHLAFFIHDERLSVAFSTTRDCERHAITAYLADVRRTAHTGDYLGYMRAMNNSHLVHLKWLDGASNQGGVVKNRPNENYAREFWELGTVGPTDLAGAPVYTDIDIAQASLAFTGWNIDTLNVNNQQICVAGRVPLLHSQGPKVIFGGTPYQATVDNDEDMLAATFRHPRMAEHLAEDLWREHLSDNATPENIRELAQLIRENNYNILPAMKAMMTSKFLYAESTRGSLVKSPIERVVGLVRITGFPLSYRRYDELMGKLEQRPGEPSTVFGWDPKKLADDNLMLQWRNALADYFVNVNLTDLEKAGFNFYNRFVLDLHQQGKRDPLDVASRIARELDVDLNSKQLPHIEQMMNYVYQSYGCPSNCNGQPFKVVRAAFDSAPDSREAGTDYDGQRKTRQLFTLIATSPEFLVK